MSCESRMAKFSQIAQSGGGISRIASKAVYYAGVAVALKTAGVAAEAAARSLSLTLKKREARRAKYKRWQAVIGGGVNQEPFIPSKIHYQADPQIWQGRQPEREMKIEGYSVRRLMQENGLGPVPATWVMAGLDRSPDKVKAWLAANKQRSAGQPPATFAREEDVRPHLESWGLSMRLPD